MVVFPASAESAQLFQKKRGFGRMKAGKTITFTVLYWLASSSLFAQVDSVHNPLLSFHDAVASVTSPKALVQLMQKEFKFQDDQSLFQKSDHWQSPEEFWNRRAGDCEDFALFTQYVLTQHGIEAYVINLYGPLGHAHTVTVFMEEGLYSIIDQDKLRHYRTKTLEAALSRVYPDWIWAARAEMKYGQGFPVETIQNPSPNSQAKFKNSFQKIL
jgi:hypothetical protein